MKNKISLLLLMSISLLGNSAFADEKGNGGGAYVKRDANGEILDAMMVEYAEALYGKHPLFRGKTFSFPSVNPRGDAMTTADYRLLALANLEKISPDYASKLRSTFELVDRRYSQTVPEGMPRIEFKNPGDVLENIKLVGYEIEFLTNASDDATDIPVLREIENALRPHALGVHLFEGHEAIYASDRIEAMSTGITFNSVNARALNIILVSNEFPEYFQAASGLAGRIFNRSIVWIEGFKRTENRCRVMTIHANVLTGGRLNFGVTPYRASNAYENPKMVILASLPSGEHTVRIPCVNLRDGYFSPVTDSGAEPQRGSVSYEIYLDGVFYEKMALKLGN